VRPPVHALEGVLDPAGAVLPGEPLPPGRRVLEPEVAYVVTSLLQGAAVRGTAAGVRRFVADQVAAKTGTSNDAKDSWLAGYSPERTTVVWVGYDENLPTRLSGSRGALPLWGKFAEGVRPRGGFPAFDRPPGVVDVVVDPTTGQLATDRCPYVVSEVFVERFAPRQVCDRHSGWFSDPLPQGWDGWERGSGEARRRGESNRRHGGLRGWLDRVFGEEDEEDEEDEEEEPVGEPQEAEEPDPPI
jgi:membrane peptidoglycan carboxypeptidase